MANRHRKEFFGPSTGIIFDSGQSSSPTIFLTLIKKKKDGSWEKISQNEGKTVKITLEEMAFILRVISGKSFVWKAVHLYEGQKTSISFEWDSEYVDKVKVKVGDYIKLLNHGEIEVFKVLLTHVLQEKITNSTVLSKKPNGSKNDVGSESEEESLLTITEEIYPSEKEPNTAFLKGVCTDETEKALLIAFEREKEIWVPKSAILSSYDLKSNAPQEFEVNIWILKKNNIMYKEVLS